MAAVEVTISGVLFDKKNRTTQNVVLIGEATLTGLGPEHPIVIPPPGNGGQPPGSGGEHPAFPIAGPGPFPPKPGYPPYPSHPIELPPDEGTKPPEPIQPPVEWKAVWTPSDGWVVVGIPNVPHPAPSS